jgi:ferredoxin
MAGGYHRRVDARIRFTPSGKSVRVPVGTTLFEAVHLAGLPLATACGAGALCGRCGVRVTSGADALAPESPRETEAKRRNRVRAELRLACQVAARADLEITTDYW